MAQLDFDENVGKQLEVLYQTRDVLRRRSLVKAAVNAAPGERILDAGCGPGYYVAELAESVVPNGSVFGEDSSPQMLAITANRCEGVDHVSLHESDVTTLPVEDADFDAALSVQVLEYVEDATRALREMHRVLRPGSRAVVWDVDWESVSWQSSDDERMRKVLTAWDEHLVHRSLPRTLGSRMRAAGFEDVAFEGHVFATDRLVPDAYGGAIVGLVAQFVTGRNGLSQDEVEAWQADLRDLDERGQYFFACVQYCFTGRKP